MKSIFWIRKIEELENMK